MSSIASYLDRLNSGETLDPLVILAEQPDLGPEVLEKLQAFVDFGGGESKPLGTLGDYTLRCQVGRGGMGVVYDAWQNSMDRRVALKVLPRSLAVDTRAVSRFIREAQLAGKLSHPNIAHVHGMGVEGQTPYYAMEFVEGETLGHLLIRQKDAAPGAATPFGKKDDVRYFANLAEAFADVADGLQHAHAKGIIHRDIKPSNLILDQEGHLRILDFGLARFEGQESLTLSGDFVGTPLYMSPEQARRRKVRLDHRTDIYSIGATLYEMLLRRPPFMGKDYQDTLSLIIEREPPEPRGLNARIPRDLETIVLKCLRKEPADRYGTAEALGQDLRRFVRGDAVEAKPLTAAEKILRRAVKAKVKLGAAALILFLFIAVLWLAFSSHRDAALRRQAAYEPAVRQAAGLLQIGSLIRRADAWGPSALDPRDLLFIQLGAQDAFWGQDRRPLEEAVDGLYRAAASVPDRPDAHYHLAKAFILLGREQEAILEIERATSLRKDFAPALALKASRLKRQGEREAAREILDGAGIAAEHGWAKTWLDSRSEFALKHWKEAIAHLDRLIELESSGSERYVGSIVESRVLRGAAFLEEKELAEALKDFAVAESLWPEAVEPRLLEAKTFYLLGEKAKAKARIVALYEKSIHRDEVALGAYAVHSMLGDFNEARHWAEKISIGYLRELLIGDALRSLGRIHESMEHARKALTFQPGGSLASIFLSGVLYEFDGKYEEALSVIDAALGVNPGEAMLHFYRGRLLMNWGKPASAIESYQRAFELNPGLSIAQADLALCLIDQGHETEGIEKLRAACDNESENQFLWNDLGVGLGNVGMLEEAADAFDKAIGVNPRFQSPCDNRGGVLERLGRLEEAFDDSRKAIELGPLSDFGGPGKIRERQGKTGEAFLAYAEALQAHPEDRSTLRRLAGLLRRRDFDEWIGVDAPLEPLIDSLERAAANSRDPVRLNALGLALARSPGRKDPDRALEVILCGLDGSGDSAQSPAESAMALNTVLDLLADERWSAVHRLAFLPVLPNYLIIDRILDLDRDRDPEKEERFLENLRAAGSGGEAGSRLLYLEGSLLQRSGRHEEAASRFALLLESDAEHPEPLIRIAESLRAAGRPQEAEERLRVSLERPKPGTDRLWNLWAAISFADLNGSPSELLETIPASAEGQGIDLRWLLERLAAGERIRIDAGGEDLDWQDGSPWGRDRFFLGGKVDHRFHGKQDPADGDPLYRSQRWFPAEDLAPAGYRIPLPRGRYQVSLHFSERWFGAPGLRKFDVRIEGVEALSGYEPFVRGFAVPDLKTWETAVDDGLLEIDFIPRIDNPTVAAIEVERLD